MYFSHYSQCHDAVERPGLCHVMTIIHFKARRGADQNNGNPIDILFVSLSHNNKRQKVHDFFAISYLHIFSQMKVGKTEKTVVGEHSTGIVFDPWTMIFSSHSVDS